MNCPKCGFEQEERLDCLRCGVVFSKYLAIHFPVLSAPLPPMPDLGPPPIDLLAQSGDLSAAELRQSLRDLHRRLADVEFDRAERNRLRKDLKEVEERLLLDLQRIESRLLRLEGAPASGDQALPPAAVQAAALPPPFPHDRLPGVLQETATLKAQLNGELTALRARLDQMERQVVAASGDAEALTPDKFVELERDLKEVYLLPLRERLDNLEDGLAAWRAEAAANPAGKTLEALSAVESRLADIEGRMTALSEEWESRGLRDLLPRLEKGLFELEDLRSSLQSVSVRYSEIGELKKNHLVVLNSLESVRMTLDAFKRQIADGFPRTLSELGKEVSALRAEYRQMWSQLQTPDLKAGQ